MKPIKIFAYLREELGDMVSLELREPVSKKTVIASFIETYPQLKDAFEECEVAVNQTFLKEDDEFKLDQIQEMAIIPPVSGG